MQHVAIDLGSKESQFCIRAGDGTLLQEGKHLTKGLAALMRRWPPSRVILETSSESFRIADQAKEAGHDVRVVPATLVRQLGVGERGIKTDRRDARKLSEVSCRVDLPSVWVPSAMARMRRSMLKAHESLMTARTQLINHVRGWMRQHLLKPKATPATLPEAVKTAAQNAGIEIPAFIESVLVVLTTLNAQILASRKRLAEEAKKDEVCVRLMTIPGVGPMSALAFVAAVDDLKRFPSAHAVQSYLGLTPGEDSSSERQRRKGITKAGPALVRRVLVQAAWAAKRCAPDSPMVRWSQGISDRRGIFIGVVALARKLAGIMFAIWRDGSEYKAAHERRAQHERKAAARAAVAATAAA